MTDFVVVTLLPLVDIKAAAAALPSTNPLSRLGTVDKIYLQDLGLRELNYASRIRRDNQAMFIQPWDGVSPVRNAADMINGLVSTFGQNIGRIRFVLTDAVAKSIEGGLLKKYVDAGFMTLSYEKAANHIHKEEALAAGATTDKTFALKVPPPGKTNPFTLRFLPTGGAAEDYAVIAGYIDETGAAIFSGTVELAAGGVTSRDFSANADALVETGAQALNGRLLYSSSTGLLTFDVNTNSMVGIGAALQFDAFEQYDSRLI